MCWPSGNSPLVFPSEPAVGEGGAADGVVLPTLRGPHERRQVPALRQGPAQKLLGHRDVHRPAAAEAVLRVQVHTTTQTHTNQHTHTHTQPPPHTHTNYTHVQMNTHTHK